MKASLFFLGPACLLMFLGPESHFNGAVMRTRAEAPSWVMLPDRSRIVETDIYNTAAGSAGHIRVRLGESGGVALEQLRRAYNASGFVINAMVIHHGSDSAVKGVLSAGEPGSGRQALVVAVGSVLGDELHITFSGPHIDR